MLFYIMLCSVFGYIYFERDFSFFQNYKIPLSAKWNNSREIQK